MVGRHLFLLLLNCYAWLRLSDNSFLLVLVFNLAAAFASSLQPAALDVPSRSLSRHRRFVVPTNSGWVFRFGITFQLQIPVDGPANAAKFIRAVVPFNFVYPFDQVDLLSKSHFHDYRPGSIAGFPEESCERTY